MMAGKNWQAGAKNSIPARAVLCLIASFAPFATAWRRARGLPRSTWGTSFAHAGVGIALIGIVCETTWNSEYIGTMKPNEVAKVAGYEGGKSALYAVIASLRPRRSRPLGHQDKIPGEIIRHGVGQADVRFTDGQTRSVSFVASRLEYSRFSTVTLVSDHSVETLVRSLVHHYDLIGGIPLLATFDRGKPIATRTDADGQVVEWDLSFAYAAIQLGIGVEVRARRGADRGVGTNLGNWVKSGFFKDRSFAGEPDLERQLDEWVAQTNNAVSVEGVSACGP